MCGCAAPPKVYTHLMFGILVFAAEQILRLLH